MKKSKLKKIAKWFGIGMAGLVALFIGLAILATTMVGEDGAPEATPSKTEVAVEATPTPTPTEEEAPKDPLADALKEADVDNVQVEQDGPLLFIKFDIKDNMSSDMIAHGAKMDTVAILKAVEESGVEYNHVKVQGHFPMMDEYGNTEHKMILNAGYEPEDVSKMNFDEVLLTKGIWDLADIAKVHPELQG